MVTSYAFTGLVLQAAESGDSISNLLKGGGFAVVVAVIAGGFAWLNSKSGAAKSIAEGAKELVEGNTAEMVRVRADAEQSRQLLATCRLDLELARREATDARTDLRASQRSLEDAQTSIRAGQTERMLLRSWIKTQCEAAKDHNEWDDELRGKLIDSGISIREAPPLSTTPPVTP